MDDKIIQVLESAEKKTKVTITEMFKDIKMENKAIINNIWGIYKRNEKYKMKWKS